MKKEIHYIIQELFVESCQQERGETLKKIMDEYLGFIKQEIWESAGWESFLKSGEAHCD